MERYRLVKNKKKKKLQNKIHLSEGCSINAKGNIIIYEDNLKQYVINKKLNTILNQIILLYKLYNVDDNDENRENLTIKIDYFKSILFKNYRLHLDDKTVNKYIKQVSSIEKQTRINKVRTNRHF